MHSAKMEVGTQRVFRIYCVQNVFGNYERYTTVEDEQDDIVNPWHVTSLNETGIDYDKLISGCRECDLHVKYDKRFGSSKIDEELVNRFQNRQICSPFHTTRSSCFRWLQETFDVPLIIQLTDDEKTLWKDLKVEEAIQLARENAKDIVAMGFNVDKTFIFNNLTFMG
uniref:Tryptophanyl-tRNA synthetase n=1 Tax=Glossina brevipalpis TaxID=37001 RepID=A0A1A9WJ56_9MUSC